MEVAAGRIRRLMVFMPPRHGKSQFISQYFPAWYLCCFPDDQIILTSYEANFAASWGRKVRNALAEAAARRLTQITVSKESSAAAEWGIADHDGGMITAGVGGAITGRGGNLLIIDDPVKNQEEAASQTYRDRAWDWYQSTFYTRAEPGAAIIIVQTRWHQDDLSGRILANPQEEDEPWEVISIPALAEEDDCLGRECGAALWPERYDLAKLQGIQQTVGSHWWASLYQQRPVPREGGFFKQHWFTIIDAAPAEVESRVRFWDKAATEGGGDWTVGVRMARTAEGLFVVEDVVRGQWSSGAVKQIILQTAATDGAGVQVVMEQEPGSAGKDVIADYLKALAGFSFRGLPATGDKALRADPLASQAEGGNVRLVRGAWNAAFIDELCAFDKGEHDDQVDAASGAFGRLATRNRYAYILTMNDPLTDEEQAALDAAADTSATEQSAP